MDLEPTPQLKSLGPDIVSPMERREEQVRRLLADVFNVRIVDVTRDDILTFTANLRRHGFMLVPEETVIR